MLRHACGYALANRGHDTRAIQGWLGHRSITSTSVYTVLAPNPSRISGGRRADMARSKHPTPGDAAREASIALADAWAAKLAPTVKELQAAGIDVTARHRN